MNIKEVTAVVYVDLRKAFDTVNHKILLKKLNKIGINQNLLKWFQNYLTDRSQWTFANNIHSNVLPLTCGVPQGSVLGPTLFLIYVNDIKNALSRANHLLYADDTALYISNNNLDTIEVDMQLDLNNFVKWCNQNALTVNVKKTKYVLYGTSHMLRRARSLTLKMGSDNLCREHVYKYLGIYLDSTLNFNKHIDYIRKITSHKIVILSKIRRYINRYTAIHIYKSMIAPIFDYSDIIYEGGNKDRLDRLQRIQNRGLRVCLGIQGYISTVILHQTAGVPKLSVKRCSNLKKYMYVQQNNPKYRIDREIPTRAHDATMLETCIPKIEKYKKGCIYRGVTLWNSLTVQERNIETYIEYKKYQYKWRIDVTNNIV